MTRTATSLATRVGVLRLAYEQLDGLTLPGAELCLSVSIVNVLHAASIRVVERGPTSVSLPELITAAGRLRAPDPTPTSSPWIKPDTPPWIKANTLLTLIQGGQALETPIKQPKSPSRWDRARNNALARRTRAKWARVKSVGKARRARSIWTPASRGRLDAALDIPIARVSYESPLELVVVISLGTASAITSFAVLVRALRLAYRNVRGLELDDAEIDAAIASLRAYQTEREADQALAESRLVRARALRDDQGEPLSIRAKRGLDLENGEAYIEEG